LERREDALQRLARLLRQLSAALDAVGAGGHRLDGLVHAGTHGPDQLRDFPGRAGRALRQLAHLVGHHGEALAVLAAPPPTRPPGPPRRKPAPYPHPGPWCSPPAPGPAAGSTAPGPADGPACGVGGPPPPRAGGTRAGVLPKAARGEPP